MNYGDTMFTTCLVENQLEDVLESGRANMLDGNETESFFIRIGVEFLGPIQGILPIGPNSIPAFGTVNFPAIPHTWVSAYNYTLHNQGIDSNISCNYSPQSPITVCGTPGDPNTDVLQYNGTCDGLGEADILNTGSFTVLNSNSTLAFWACKSSQSEAGSPSYSIYFCGIGSSYERAIGNITCTISQLHSTIFLVTYRSNQGYFSTEDPSPANSTIFSGLTDQSVISFARLVEEGQGRKVGNLLAELIFTFGIGYHGLPSNDPDPKYLELYELMIKGVMEYLVTYTRLIYNLYSGTKQPAPSSCNRQVDGTITYQVMGWFVKNDHIGFLMPFTIVNLASLILMIFAILGTSSNSYNKDPVNAESLALAELQGVILVDGTLL